MSKTRGTGTRNQRSPVLSFFKDITMKTLRNIPVMLKILSNKTGALRLSLATNEDDKKMGYQIIAVNRTKSLRANF